MSRNARTLSDSKSLKEGMSPGSLSIQELGIYGKALTFDDLAKNTSCVSGCHFIFKRCSGMELRKVLKFKGLWW